MSTQTINKSFIIYKDSLSVLNKLTDEQAGKLFKAIFNYQTNNVLPEDTLISIIFEPFLNQFKRDDIKYQNVVEKNKINGSKGGRPKTQENPLGYLETQGNPRKPKKADSDSDSKNDNKNDNKNEECKSELINHNQNINVDFQEFWDHYTPIECNGRMVSKDSKKLAEEKYQKLRSKYNHNLIMSKLEKYLTNCKKNSILTKAVHRWLTTTDFNDNEETTSIISNKIATKQDLQKSQDAEIYKNFMERTSNSNYINHFKE
jgi:hypothetical protein